LVSMRAHSARPCAYRADVSPDTLPSLNEGAQREAMRGTWEDGTPRFEVSMRAHSARPCAIWASEVARGSHVSMRAHSARPCASWFVIY
jgi:hypothetical protein